MTTAPKRRWPQFNLRTLFAVVTIVALTSIVIKQRIQERVIQAENAALRAKNTAIQIELHETQSERIHEDARAALMAPKPSDFRLPHLQLPMPDQVKP
jgi:cell division protein FtsB